MKRFAADFFVCPDCLPREIRLSLRESEAFGEEVVSGQLVCDRCDAIYSVEAGIASLLPKDFPRGTAAVSRYETDALVASYLWSHYADFEEDGDATTAYAQWAQLVTPAGGPALDVGCAVGRFSFEISPKFDVVIGIDASRRFIETARALLINRRLEYDLVREGRLFERRTVEIPQLWDSRKVEYVVADAQRLPFRTGCFSLVASLNLVDKLPEPLQHLQELGRVADKQRSQLLFSDPFSWSTACCPEQDWLGGRSDGPFAGGGFENICSLLQRNNPAADPPWTIDKRGEIWWKIRNHRNHFELIRSCYIKASR